MLLLLAGTGEARVIARTLAEAGIPAIASLSGATREPAALDIETRVGGFGGEAGFKAFLANAGISAILDATHPFAARISRRSARIAHQMGTPYLQVLRAPWVAGTGDRWTMIAHEQDAAVQIPAGSTVFLATGRQTLPRFENLSGCRVICRQIDAPDQEFPFPGGEFLVGRPPFSVADEEKLFTSLGVDWLVVKNAGGQAPRTKLVAARNLAIPVAMIERPEQPDVLPVETAEQAMAWVRALPW